MPTKSVSFTGAVLACGIVALTPVSASQADEMSEYLCQRGAEKYQLYRSWQGTLSPEKVIRVYAETFMSSEFDREVQAVWRRMISGEERDVALELHLDRYHSKLSDQEQVELRQRIIGELVELETYYDLALKLESLEITPELVAEEFKGYLVNSDLVSDESHYTAEIMKAAQKYMLEGHPADDAALRAGIDVRDMADRDRGVRTAREPGNQHTNCYLDALWLYELGLRRRAISRLPEAGSEAAKYFLDFEYPRNRFSAWQAAADP